MHMDTAATVPYCRTVTLACDKAASTYELLCLCGSRKSFEVVLTNSTTIDNLFRYRSALSGKCRCSVAAVEATC